MSSCAMAEDQAVAELVSSTGRKLRPVEQALRSHRCLAALEDRRVSPASSFRFSRATGGASSILPAGEFFTGMAQGEERAFDHLLVFAAALGIDEDWLYRYEPHPICQAYPSYVASLALGGSRADVVLAFVGNLAAWGENCGRMGSALRAAYDYDANAVAFFDFFATPPPEFEVRALEVIKSGLAKGESEVQARRAARLLQAYELIYWDALAEAAAI